MPAVKTSHGEKGPVSMESCFILFESKVLNTRAVCFNTDNLRNKFHVTNAQKLSFYTTYSTHILHYKHLLFSGNKRSSSWASRGTNKRTPRAEFTAFAIQMAVVHAAMANFIAVLIRILSTFCVHDCHIFARRSISEYTASIIGAGKCQCR